MKVKTARLYVSVVEHCTKCYFLEEPAEALQPYTKPTKVVQTDGSIATSCVKCSTGYDFEYVRWRVFFTLYY